MKRYHITLGAGTTAGGKVTTATSCCSINGVKVALEGDKIICPACKSEGSIQIFGPRIPESWNGKQVALQDDLCVCKCPLPPRLVANQSLKCQVVDGGGGGVAGADGTSSSAASPEEVASTARRDTQAAAIEQSEEKVMLRFLDEYSQAPIAAKRYRLELPDKIIEGQTDADGYSEPIDAADRDRLLAWHIVG
jgi:uncharacterized Zn-binding protein involved in type VI secretion